MPLFQIDNSQPYKETPESASDYSSISPSTPTRLKAVVNEGISYLGGAAERGSQAGSSWFDSALAHMFVSRDAEPDQVTPLVAPKELKTQYDLDSTTPIPRGLASIMGRQKEEERERESVLNRYAQNHGFLTNMGVSMAGFMLDPLNDASLFVPGLGEDYLVGRLGGGFLARTAARAVSGGTQGAFGQVPLSGLKYGLGSEQESDYGIYDAAKDVALGAAFGAIQKAGFGAALHETGLLGPDQAIRASKDLQVPSLAEKITDPVANHQAISTAASQIASERPLNVEPIFQDTAEYLARDIDPDLFARHDKLKSQIDGWRSRLSSEDATLTDFQKEGFLKNIIRADEELRDLIPKVADARGRTRELLNSNTPEGTAFKRWSEDKLFERWKNLSQEQKDLYNQGYALGYTQDDVKAAKEAVYSLKPEKPEANPQKILDAAKTFKTTAFKVQDEHYNEVTDILNQAEVKSKQAQAKPISSGDPELDELEEQWKQVSGSDTTGELQKILTNISDKEDGYDQASNCVIGSGL